MFLLLLVTVAVLVDSAAVSLTVNLSPRTANVSLGSSVTLNCSLEVKNVTGNVQGKTSWFFCQCQLDTSRECNKRSSLPQESIIHEHKGYQLLTLTNVTLNNSGYYYCQVTINKPVLKQMHSNGTQVIVSANGQPESTTSSLKTAEPANTTARGDKALGGWMLWAAVGGGSAILVVVFGMVVWTWHRQRRRRGKDDPIYANTHVRFQDKHPSPRPGTQADGKNNHASHLGTQTPRRIHDYQRSPRH